jgi:hypothetical protein
MTLNVRSRARAALSFPATASFERHLRFVLGATGHAHMLTVASTEGCCSTEKVLEAGMTWSRGPFVCRYVRNELTCEREQHGFRIGRKVVVAY